MDDRHTKAIRPIKRNGEWYAIEILDGDDEGRIIAGPFDSESDAWDWVQHNTGAT
jgi:hypothetical protein